MSYVTSSAKIVAAFGGPSVWFEKLGIIPLTGYTISKLAYLADREPEHFARIAHILLPHDYLNHWLTGRFVAEYGDASGTGFFLGIFTTSRGCSSTGTATRASRFATARESR